MRRLVGMWLPIGLIGIWSLVTFWKIVDPLFLPPPWAVAKGLWTGLAHGSLARDFAATVLRSVVGFAAAAILGVPLAIGAGWFSIRQTVIRPSGSRTRRYRLVIHPPFGPSAGGMRAGQPGRRVRGSRTRGSVFQAGGL